MAVTKVMEATNVSYAYGSKPVLNHVSLSLNKGEVVSLLGPNGSGKSTLLKLLLGIYSSSTGEVRLDGALLRTIPRKSLAKRIAYVPQLHALSFPYSVLSVVLMGRIAYRSVWSSYSETDRLIALHALERLHISHLKDRPYTELSGGERQLALIARALTQEANILVMDEPITGLDYGNQVRLLQQISELAREGYTFLKSTHFPDHALLVANRVVLLKEGRVIDEGLPDHVVTQENMQRLYQITVDIITVRDGIRCCVPRLPSSNHLTDIRGQSV